MKALEFLKKYQDEIQTSIPQEIELDEIIKELEDMNNRSCLSCKTKKHCYIWDYAGIPIDSLKDFWCNGWESK